MRNLKNVEIQQSLQTKIAAIYQDGNDERINAVRDAVFAYVCSREPETCPPEKMLAKFENRLEKDVKPV